VGWTIKSTAFAESEACVNENELRRHLRLFWNAFRQIQEDVDSIRAQQERNEQQRNIQPVWLDPVISEYKQAETDKKTNEDRHYSVQNSLRWATWLAFGAATVYAGISYTQWRDAKRNFRVDQRAWIGVQFPPTPFNVQPGGTVEVPFVVVNSGKTPAKSVSGQFVTFTFSKEEPVAFNFDHGWDLTYPVLFPNQPIPSKSILISFGTPKSDPAQIQIITPPIQAALTQEGAYLATYGWLSYMDVFGKWHWIHACATSSPSGTSKLTKECVLYNDTGEGKDSHQKQ
jgi:hypothetical protein